MKFLRDQIDKLKPTFSEGGKLSFLHSTFDAFETFLFVPNHTTQSGSHIRDGIDLKRTMFIVIIAMLPALMFGLWNVGHQQSLALTGADGSLWDNFFVGLIQTLPIIIVSYGVGLGIEMGFAQFRGHPVNEGFLVTGMLIPLCMPPDVPLWMVGLATAFSVVIGKEVFGGTGMNLLNPALTARMFLYIGYPSSMSGDSVWTFLPEGSKTVDGYSGATNLGELASATAEGKPWSDDILSASIMDSFWGNIQGSIGETSVVACLIGAVILISAGVGSWKIMVSTILGGLFMGWIFNISVADGAYMDMPAYYHLIIGGFMFGAIFMTTDPVSAAQTEKGKWIYGFLIGVLTVLIRVFNPGYPEGIMMAILLMNVFAPLIDYYVVQSNIKTRLNRVKV
ncbi:MAG: NADH:ubiquinone reductase (Na(+)-transporting) subunit B [Bacteroidia bacterium]|nr:NADH:ubiquinone reductase (Na(+)-transporting) subunit B [Bacteroidia bacterium]MDG2042463.1 NADH:ubiquinone reductase (Na(+)-transporting) subunit B [Bacteroidia bacterium]|tara:strand:+ start:5268 stop:6449 length:1182 start_codon:yes stop_codon:yes gene_type:complete